MRIVLLRLRVEKLYANFSKCEVWLISLAFLGHVVSKEGIRVDPAKIEAIRGWTRPTSPTEIRSFGGIGRLLSTICSEFLYYGSSIN